MTDTTKENASVVPDSFAATLVRRPLSLTIFSVSSVSLWLVFFSSSAASCAEATPEQVFERRIVPIFKSANPSSCVQCHLSGVDLKNYILPSSEKTFLSLRDQGLIDLKAPAAPKILKLINMRKDNRDGPNPLPATPPKPEFT